MKLTVLVVDDESLARNRMRTLLGDCKTPAISVAGEAANATQAIELMRRQLFDVALLDIRMPGADGLTLAQALRAMPRPPALIFVTAHAEHAVQAFELEAVDYLTKPVRLERLQQALQKVERLLLNRKDPEPETPEEVLIIQGRSRTERVPLSEVLYLKAELKYVTVRTSEKSHILDGSLSELEKKFATQFLRIHRNALVARRAIRALEKHYDPQEGDGWAVRLTGLDELLVVSRRQLAAVRDVMAGQVDSRT